MASKLQLPPLNFEARGSLTADFHIPDSPPHSRPGTPSRDAANASSRTENKSAQTGLTNKPSSSSLQVSSPNSPPMSPQSPRPGSVRRLLSKMSLSGSYKESDEASVLSLKSPTAAATPQPFNNRERDFDVTSEKAMSTISNKSFFSSFRRNSSKRSASSSRKAAIPPPAPREPTIKEKTAELIKKQPAPQIPDLPQASVSSFDNDLFKNI
ncbi:hypothetical protein H072_9951 [Dactylellina haptotyla CBS 200.50]|uniref:Uncharacterized protein n=1 Tax=Dactylellina haptotyla (strain CBS 200.50) TaxID=1284197 RepID=S8BBG5_DACHA|nr:hypothetical protein H072_9951 [Dactylellina haptotyla CBS 200.50]